MADTTRSRTGTKCPWGEQIYLVDCTPGKVASRKIEEDCKIKFLEHKLTLVVQNGKVSSERHDSKDYNLTQLYNVSWTPSGELCMRFNFRTNITSKSHDRRKFRVCANVKRISGASVVDEISGHSRAFELTAKPKGTPKIAPAQPQPGPTSASSTFDELLSAAVTLEQASKLKHMPDAEGTETAAKGATLHGCRTEQAKAAEGKLQSNEEQPANTKTGKPSILQHSKELLPSLSGKNGIPAKSALLEPSPKLKVTAERKRKALYTKEQENKAIAERFRKALYTKKEQEDKATAERKRKALPTKEQEDIQATTNTKTAEAALDPNIQWICTKIICPNSLLGFEAQRCPCCKMPRTIVGADVSTSRHKRGAPKETSKQPEEDAAKVKRASCQKSCPDCMKLSWPATKTCTCGHIFKKKAKLL